MRPAYRLVRAGVFWLSRGDATLQRGLHAFMRAAGGFLAEALTFDERSDLGVALYDRAFAGARERGLFTWERDWFAERLPKAPARVLVGGAGDGREAIALAGQGYLVDACEPASRPAAACAERLGPRSLVLACSYEDLSRAILDGGGGPAAPLAERRYDAVVLGWGSLTHVLQRGERERALHSAARLCPGGPILMSFWLGLDEEVAAGRAERAGRALGRAVGRLRGAEPAEEIRFGWRYGFGHPFRRIEIEALGARVGRQVVWEESPWRPYPHVTLLPTTQMVYS